MRAAINHPWTAIRTVKSNVARPFIEPPSEQSNILEMDWDNLIILDACRYDTFKKHNSIDGNLRKIYSTSSHTAEFVEKNINKYFQDTVYITASPQLAGQGDKFHHLEHLWQDFWDDDLRTIPPWDVTDQAKKIARFYPHKRLIVHYMQPHYPFIGGKGSEIGEHATFTGNVEDREATSVWDLLAAGKINTDLAQAAYEENLDIALESVCDLVDSLVGKTVISSDHGNLFRKKIGSLPVRINGHPKSFPDPELLSVPWLEVQGETRKEIIEDTSPTSDPQSYDDNIVQDRLADLGYL